MKAIIDGKRYDTEKAILIGEDTSGGGRSHFGWWEEGLYRTKQSGIYFLAGEGGPRSHYAENLGQGSWGRGSKITPLSEKEAQTWAERHLAPHEVEAAFGATIEDA
ncbi:hypothetical protein SAMN05421763_11710 [[Luteovulum] sphaeroides subsp. megalophilum]|uniref:hypothetical protein n=1 Tax=Cereibacter sphaeroides TaxID=1063 RepID=UPI000B6C2D48|nr:hypothetical protein [Cereibacter sphaeroides]SNT42115.1 hypothetical protein SAMN05421763_11710 [[Luteovulum] sphaeroides subsp. megalophilum]